MDIFAQMVEKIIRQQEGIIGPIALEQARKVPGLSVDLDNHKITLVGNKKAILEKLVGQYEHLFGPASVEVCKDAVSSLVTKAPQGEVPQLLLS